MDSPGCKPPLHPQLEERHHIEIIMLDFCLRSVHAAVKIFENGKSGFLS